MSTEMIREMAELLFAGGADELIAKKTDFKDPESRQELGRKIGQSTNTLGAIAGPAALYSAVRHRKEGGIPRDIASGVGPRMARSKHPKVKNVGRKINRGVRTLNAAAKGRGSTKAKIAAGAAAAGAVGLQGVNWIGDTAPVTPGFRTPVKAKEKNKVSKASPDSADVHVPSVPTKGKLARLVINDPRVQAKGKEYGVKTGGALKKLPEKVKKSDEIDVVWEGEIAKADSDKQQIFGWASVVEVNGEPVVDLQGDYISTDEMEKAGYEYVMKSRKGGDMHLRDDWSPVQKSEMIESFIVTPEKRDALGLPDSVPSGWWVGFQVQDPEVWAKVRSGERTGFSIHGHGRRSPA